MRDHIYDPETGNCVASFKDGVVYRDSGQGEQIATLRAGNLYDLSGNLVGHLEGLHVTGLRTASLPVSFKKLL